MGAAVSGPVEVLLSTYNGEKHLAEQLDSIWRQSYSEVWLSVRDDGSSDGTLAVLDRLLSGRRATKLVMGAHRGAAQSFMSLLRGVSPEASYAAFCDQDDVWLPEKLEVAVTRLAQREGPAMYCSAVTLVTEDLAELKVHRRCVRGPSFENALVENVATGCTIVLNRPAVDLLSSQRPTKLVMHDAWCYLVVAACGEVVYDPAPHVLYRLHGGNTVGVGTNLWKEWSGRVKRQLDQGKDRVLTAQAEELRDLYGRVLRPAALQALEEFLSARSPAGARLRYAMAGGAHRQRLVDDLVYRSLYVVGRI
jgi:glycosyltransferase involved in cell wall biosynthesis